MNITIFISSLYGGGAERVACNLANFLEKKGHTIEILTIHIFYWQGVSIWLNIMQLFGRLSQILKQ